MITPKFMFQVSVNIVLLRRREGETRSIAWRLSIQSSVPRRDLWKCLRQVRIRRGLIRVIQNSSAAYQVKLGTRLLYGPYKDCLLKVRSKVPLSILFKNFLSRLQSVCTVIRSTWAIRAIRNLPIDYLRSNILKVSRLASSHEKHH